MANFKQNMSSEGLRTLTVNIDAAGLYNFQGTLTLPKNMGTVTAGAGAGAGTGSGAAPPAASQVVTVINKNGSPIFTSNAGAMGFCLIGVSCAANDVMTFVTSSSLAQDQQPNAVRLTLAVSEGPI